MNYLHFSVLFYLHVRNPDRSSFNESNTNRIYTLRSKGTGPTVKHPAGSVESVKPLSFELYLSPSCGCQLYCSFTHLNK